MLFKPIKTSKYDTCETIEQADKQACIYYSLHGTIEQKNKCKKEYLYQDVFVPAFLSDGGAGRVYTGCNVTVKN